MSEVTRLLNDVEAGDDGAVDRLLPLVYDELRRLAAQKMAQEKPGQTLQATALVHEAYLRLLGGELDRHFDGSRHFFAAAAEAMRRILVDNARRKAAAKRGGDRQRIDLETLSIATTMAPEQLLVFDEMLTELASEDETGAKLARILYYAGLSVDEAAKAVGVSSATAYRHWAYARAWLKCQLANADS